MIWIVLRYLLIFVAIVCLTAFVITVYAILCTIHKNIMNPENTKDDAQI